MTCSNWLQELAHQLAAVEQQEHINGNNMVKSQSREWLKKALNSAAGALTHGTGRKEPPSDGGMTPIAEGRAAMQSRKDIASFK